MKRPWWRSWLFLALIAALGAVGSVHLVAWSLTRDRPNYSRVEDGLWMGGSVKAPPPGTGAVLNLCELEDPYRADVHSWEHIPDAAPAPDLDWLRRQVRFVEEQRRTGRVVYVHCRAGVSRAGMVVAAYLMAEHRWTRDEALTFLRTRRPQVNPNPAFLDRLAEWEHVVQANPAEPRP
jgi:protein-tyrosine phosphatase